MSRLVWVGVGAAGGILAYRRGQRAWERTKERGVAGNTAAITRTVADIYRGIRDAEKSDPADILDITDRAVTSRVAREVGRDADRAPGGGAVPGADRGCVGVRVVRPVGVT